MMTTARRICWPCAGARRRGSFGFGHRRQGRRGSARPRPEACLRPRGEHVQRPRGLAAGAANPSVGTHGAALPAMTKRHAQARASRARPASAISARTWPSRLRPGRRAGARRGPERVRVADEESNVPRPREGHVQSALVGHERRHVGAASGAHRGDYNHVGLGALEGVHSADTQALPRLRRGAASSAPGRAPEWIWAL